jgi:hypothetical protein
MLYMFQAVPPPIIRSSKLYTHHRVFVELFSQKKLDINLMMCVQFELLMMGGGTA